MTQVLSEAISAQAVLDNVLVSARDTEMTDIVRGNLDYYVTLVSTMISEGSNGERILREVKLSYDAQRIRSQRAQKRKRQNF